MSKEYLCLWLRRSFNYVRKEFSRFLRKELGQHVMAWCSLGLKFMSELKKANVKNALEIGTGTGFLTRFIAEVVKNIVSVEIDYRLLRIARKLLGSGFSNIYYVAGDGLALMRSESVRADVIVSNTPFNISTQLIITLIKSNYNLAVLTLQYEVAKRLKAKQGSRDYSRLSVLGNLFLDVDIVGTYPPKAFYPAPEVSVVLTVIKRKMRWDRRYEGIENFLGCLFSNKRKKLSNALKLCYSNDRILLRVKDIIDTDAKVFQIEPGNLINVYLAIKDLLNR